MSDEKDSVMLLPTSFYDKLDPKYREKLVELEKTLKLENSGKTAVIYSLMDFLNQFMMPKEFWTKLFELIYYNEPPVIATPFKIIVSSSFYQFIYDRRDYIGNVRIPKIMKHDHLHRGWDIDVEELCYPQKYLEEKLVEYEKTYASSFIPISIIRSYEKMKSLYSKIKSVEENEDEWFKALKEVEDGEFIEHNIEYRIGSDLTNKKLWKMYIEYLKENNQEKLLQTYSKCCRFFLDDIRMIEEYRKAVGDKKVTVPWKNTFDFEIYVEFYDQNYFDEIAEPKITVKPPLTCFFNAENALPQKFPFKPNLMFYILKNANAYVLHNLFKSCKWFYLKNPVSIFYRVVTNNTNIDKWERFDIKEQSLSFGFKSLLPEKFGKIYISTGLKLQAFMFPHFIARIYRCTAKYVSLSYIKLSDDEMDILIGHGNVEDLYFCAVRDSNEKWFILENVLKLVPKIKNLSISCIYCTSKTSQILSELTFDRKIQAFAVEGIKDTLLEPNVFTKFIRKNISPTGWITLDFHVANRDFVRNFEEIVDIFVKENWKELKNPPRVSVF